ncbi:Kirola [Sesamum angolense]|uniref:Kirola n=1 Tax=Sesamum angolense TaxID=2727404 RepID=A0AAE1WV10_9LAMI|nr:Kirola [Sesamum angolense]
MALNGKLVSSTSIKLDGDLFFELCRYKLSDMANICPQIVHNVDLVAGQWGAVGSVFCSNYTLDGEKKFVKAKIEAIDETKRSITYKVVEGSVLEVYTSFKVTCNIDCNGQHKVVTWSFEYEKKSACVPHPHTLPDLFSALTKLLELRCLLVPN